MKNKFLSCALVVTLLITAFASTLYANEVFKTSATVEDIVKNSQLMKEIEDYLNSKLDTEEWKRKTDETNLSNLERDKVNRAEGFQALEKIGDIEFGDVEITFQVKEVLEQTRTTLTLEVYEWTSIDYLSSELVAEEDVMGYGVYHEMIFTLSADKYTLVNDSFDESFITGVRSVDYAERMEQEGCLQLESVLGDNYLEDVEIMASNATYNVTEAIRYANQYCGISASSQSFADANGEYLSGNHSGNYNSAYTYYAGADCANFVSQCLKAGGLATDSTWTTYTSAWVNAKALATYLSNKYTAYSVADGGTNIYPGNPVYWINTSGSASGHQMICTGYNASGVPVLNGHNHDMYRVPYTFAENIAMTNHGVNLQTVHIVTYDKHNHESATGSAYSQTIHTGVCNHCRKNYSASHSYAYNYNSSSHWRECVVCDYVTGSYSSHSLSYHNNANGHWTECATCDYKGANEQHVWFDIGLQYQCGVCGRTQAII